MYMPSHSANTSAWLIPREGEDSRSATMSGPSCWTARQAHIADTLTPLTSRKSRAVRRNDTRAARATSQRNTSEVSLRRLGMPSISSVG